ncbi:hypothetical protein [Winogradskyella sp. PG-2]|uniref:hypothetical protein n=1 Tax=Winogradskyella sp. PG-2 TaxID=754409 RepID=UPI000458660D|nr:hypothetical protein [Winogradskyella sp. PG-2]BAO76706.1 hypothetical protein WPG_2476 [Winogradskyella sp. PG-2]
MKRDIRELFSEEKDLKILPENHRTEFLDKLKKQLKKKSNSFFWLRIAAVVIVALTVGFNVFYNKPVTEEISPMIAQIEAVESKYLEDIENEWESFVAITSDELLVARYKKRLDELDEDYQEISNQFKVDSNNILVIESLVENLKTRLQILKDIQEHIKILNQNNEQYEKSI